MWTRKRLRIHTIPFFVTVNFLYRKQWFLDPVFARSMEHIINEQRAKYHFVVFEYVLMPDHYHAIVLPAQRESLGHLMQAIHSSFARRFHELNNSSGRVFQREYYDHGIRGSEDYRVKATYIHLNPVRAGLCQRPEEYPWSSAQQRLTGTPRGIIVDNLQ